jgi:hypothetical protein
LTELQNKLSQLCTIILHFRYWFPKFNKILFSFRKITSKDLQLFMIDECNLRKWHVTINSKERSNLFVIELSMNPKSYVVTSTPRSNKHSWNHRLYLDISIAKDTGIQIHGWLDYNLIWPLDRYKIRVLICLTPKACFTSNFKSARNSVLAIVPSVDIKRWDIQKRFIVYQTFALSQIVRLTIVTLTSHLCNQLLRLPHRVSMFFCFFNLSWVFCPMWVN